MEKVKDKKVLNKTKDKDLNRRDKKASTHKFTKKKDYFLEELPKR